MKTQKQHESSPPPPRSSLTLAQRNLSLTAKDTDILDKGKGNL